MADTQRELFLPLQPTQTKACLSLVWEQPKHASLSEILALVICVDMNTTPGCSFEGIAKDFTDTQGSYKPLHFKEFDNIN